MEKIQHIKLRHNGKIALEKWSLPENRYSYEEVLNFPDLAIIPPKGIQVIDIDDEKTMNVVDNILKSLGIETLTLKTPRGKHYWFKTDGETEAPAGQPSLSTLKVDYRNHKCYLVLKSNGESRQWSNMLVTIGGTNCITDDMIAELPLFLKKSDRKLQPALGLGEGDGRNDFFMKNYITPIVQQGLNDDLRGLMDIINDYIFMEPLPSSEIDSLLINDDYRSKIEVKKHKARARIINLNKMRLANLEAAQELIEEYDIKSHNNSLYIRNGLVYDELPRLSEEYRDTIELWLRRWVTKNQRDDVLAEAIAISKQKQTEVSNEELVTRYNKVNVMTGEIIPHKKDDFIFNYIDEEYNPNAYHQRTDEFYNQVFGDHQEIRNFWFEFIGYMFLEKTNNKEAIALLLVGEGGNGKSLLMETVKSLLGEKNYSALNMKKFNEEYTLSTLKGKMANFGDDENHTGLKELGPLKSVISGSSIIVNEKYVNPYTITPHAKLLFATNEIPTFVRDNTEGIKRRFKFIEFKFNARANPDTELYKKLNSKEGRQYTLKLIVEGGKRWKKQKGLSKVGDIEKFTKEQFNSQNVMHNFIDEIWGYLKFENMLVISSPNKNLQKYTLYQIYKNWAEYNHAGIVKPTRFKQELLKLKDDRFSIVSNKNTYSIKGETFTHDGNKFCINNPEKGKSKLDDLINNTFF